ncbi:MAG: hypothetical protein NVS4B1_09610 [Ktedonobacteraceae bacterium]
MSAGLIAGQIQGLRLPECDRLAAAFSLGTITQISFHLPSLEVIQTYEQQVASSKVI